MAYTVFFVEDEIAIREGIRDNVDWVGHGFHFCGEAADGELALPLIQATKPDLLITDIRMPFMDGLQLSQIVRDRLPTTRIIVLSGHDEFEYAQKAIQLGVFEYLLKPVSLQDLHRALEKVASALEQERGDQQALQQLRHQVEQNRAALRERFLFRLVTGVSSPSEAIEKGHQLGLDLIAKCYLVIALRIEPHRSQPPDLAKLRQVLQQASMLVENNPDAFLLRKDLSEWVLLLKGNSEENVYDERDLLLARMREEAIGLQAELISGCGAPRSRVTEIYQSFLEASDSLRAATSETNRAVAGRVDEARLLDVDKSAVEDYLMTGAAGDFDTFFEAFSFPLGGRTPLSPLVKGYVLTNVALATARFVDGLGGNADQIVPELDDLEGVLVHVETMAHLRETTHKIVMAGLSFRDARVLHQNAEVVRQAQECMERRYTDPELSLNQVAAQVNLSAGHFSTVFSQETGHTFKEHLTDLRMRKAKELLRTTTLKAFEIAYQVGYNDPHYFSHVFHKHTGLTPMEFRLQVQAL